LQRNKYFARQDFWCCDSCALSAVPEYKTRVIFYHRQAMDSMISGILYLNWWGQEFNMEKVKKIFESCGLIFETPPNDDVKIKVRYLKESHV
jgi:hypothetical protein